jgi:hypothetical protein
MRIPSMSCDELEKLISMLPSIWMHTASVLIANGFLLIVYNHFHKTIFVVYLTALFVIRVQIRPDHSTLGHSDLESVWKHSVVTQCKALAHRCWGISRKATVIAESVPMGIRTGTSSIQARHTTFCEKMLAGIPLALCLESHITP